MDDASQGMEWVAASPQPAPEPPPIPMPEDLSYPGVIQLRVDARDVERAIFQVSETIPVSGPGPLILMYPKWLPGFHSPVNSIELLAGLEIHAGNTRLAWRRDAVEMHAFHVVVPEGCEALEARFQFLSPTAQSQGTIAVTPAMAAVRWAAMVLYPAGYFSRGFEVDAELTLPEGWESSTALDVLKAEGGVVRYRRVTLDVLVDSPVLAGQWLRRETLDAAGEVELTLVGDRPDEIAPTEDQLGALRAMVAEVDALFGARHYDRYAFLAAVSEEIGGGGVEHQASNEIVLKPNHFTAWHANVSERDVFAHEYIHSWNGKFRVGADSWAPCFYRPIRNSLMWVYEGLTQYWGEMIAARSGLWTAQQARDALARTAAIYANRPGGCWRPMSDTTRDPIIAERQPLPWQSWQRSEDYYAEGQLLWLDVDTLIRELSGDTRSLDDFARAFFGVADRQTTTITYTFDDVTAALNDQASFDWKGFLVQRLESREVGAPLDGLTRGGYRLVYRDVPNDLAISADALAGVLNLRFSIGVSVGADGTLQEVVWGGPAFDAGLVAGAKILAVDGYAFSDELLQTTVGETPRTGCLELLVQRGQRSAAHQVRYKGGNRFPHLEAIQGARPRLDEILASKA